MADKMSIDKQNPTKEERESEREDSMDSSPEGEAPAATNTAQENQQPKRKGGRKPVSPKTQTWEIPYIPAPSAFSPLGQHHHATCLSCFRSRVPAAPVIIILLPVTNMMTACRYMQLLRRGSRGIARLRRLFASDGPSTSSSSRRLSVPTSKTWPTFRLLTDMRPTSA